MRTGRDFARAGRENTTQAFVGYTCNPASEEMTVRLASGELKLALAWVADEVSG